MADPYPIPTRQQIANIPERQMQFVVGLGVVGGLGAAAMVARGIREAETPEEREALLNVAKLGAGLAVAVAVYYALGIDKKWLTVESAGKAVEERFE